VKYWFVPSAKSEVVLFDRLSSVAAIVKLPLLSSVNVTFAPAVSELSTCCPPAEVFISDVPVPLVVTVVSAAALATVTL